MIKPMFFFLLLLLATGLHASAQQEQRPAPQPPAETGEKFRVGMAGYSFAKVNDLDKSLSIMQRADVHY